MADEALLALPMDALVQAHPHAAEFFAQYGFDDWRRHESVAQLVARCPLSHLENHGIDRAEVLRQFLAFVDRMGQLERPKVEVRSLTILGGHDKSGRREEVALTLTPGDIVCVVGPTGSGKSRLLADIECLAQEDTPTGRKVLLNGDLPPPDLRHSGELKLVAQLSQNMNFVVDLTVEQFVAMHAESRMIRDAGDVVQRIVACANDLAGERFGPDVPVTQLSGGQSRALMIADTALLSPSPIVLIDEIENAGVDRKKALRLLVRQDKIVLMSTHDPILALLGGRRIVIRNGGIHAVVETGPVERANLAQLEHIDSKLMALRNLLRGGGSIDFDMKAYFGLGAALPGPARKEER
jgi:ABC-type lipoprotein export system ATPase subunit